jgi:K+ transporter
MAQPAAPPAVDPHPGPPTGKLWPLALGTIGVAYGEIRTSALYAFTPAISVLSAVEGRQLVEPGP